MACLDAEPPEPGAWEAGLAVARLSEDPGQLQNALTAIDAPLLMEEEWAGFRLAQAVLMAKLGRSDDVPEALMEVLGEVQMLGEAIPRAFSVLLEALLALSMTSPDAAAAALVSAFELTSPSPDVWPRGLGRIENALMQYPEGLPTLRALVMLANDAVGSEERAQELEDLLRQMPPADHPQAELARLALESREAGRLLEGELAALKEQGVPLTIMDAVPKPVPEAENAAFLYQTVFQVRFQQGEVGPDEPGQAGPAVGELDKAIAWGDDGPQLDAATRELLSSPRAQEVLQTLRGASLRPHCAFPLHWEDLFGMLLPHMAKFRAAARILAAYSRLLAEDGRLDEALDWCMVGLRMSQHAASEPILISQLVSVAMQAITLKTVREIVSPAALPAPLAHRCDECLRRVDVGGAFGAALIFEQAAVCDLYAKLRQEPQQLYDFFPAEEVGLAVLARFYFSPLGGPLHNLDQLFYLEHVRKLQDVIDLPYRDAAAELDAIYADMGNPAEHMGAATVIPAMRAIIERRDRALAELGLCRVVLALKAYKHREGVYPEGLEQLQESLHYPLPKDPFSGEDFVYRPQGDGFRLYSLSGDLDDDGGVPPDKANPDDGDIVCECIR